ncbi:MAG TPA: DUF2235 domain-containing protein [Gemmatimonadaceae bacterium]|jgi:uncharacterized protein (DUF2235 family)
MSRNLVICCDGTNNQFGPRNTNVIRLIQVLADKPADSQLVYYDPGIGTLAEPGWVTRAGKWFAERLDGAIAVALHSKVERAYTFLADVWQPGDRIFLFGFSRGAYTVRALGALLHAIGLLPPRSQNQVPYAMRLFGALAGYDGQEEKTEYFRRCRQFRLTFARHVPDKANRRVPIACMGLWDTVSTVGWAWNPQSLPYTAGNPSISVVRHAVSIDERRAFFRQNLIKPIEGQDAEERWFAGVHSDIGGGYTKERGKLWRASFEWVVREAMASGLRVDESRLRRRLGGAVVRDVWREPINDSLTPSWWPAEFFPKLVRERDNERRSPRLNLFASRIVPKGAILDFSLLQRIVNDHSYAPASLSKEFVAQVRGTPPSGCIPYLP